MEERDRPAVESLLYELNVVGETFMHDRNLAEDAGQTSLAESETWVARDGGAIFVYVTVGSLLWGRKLDSGAPASRPTPIPPTPASVAMHGVGSSGFAAPGTFALAMVFLTAFMLYYFINWKYLSQVWGLS